MKKWLGLVVGLVAVGYISFQFLHSYEQRLTNFKQDGSKIVAFGDSLTAGFGASDPANTYPAKLAALFAKDVINLGRNGETTASALRRVQEVLNQKPNYVLITLGGNDLRQRVDLGQTLANLERLFTELQQAGIAVAYVSINPPLVGDNWSMAIRDVVRSNGVLWIDDVMKGLWGDSALMADAVHPNDSGYEIMATRIHQSLKRHIN